MPVIEAGGDLTELVAEFNATIPGEDSQAYRDPSEAERAALIEAVRATMSGAYGEAAGQLDRLGYDLLRFADASGGEHFVLRERRPYRRGWGLFVLNADPEARNVTVETPHPIWDALTTELGLEAYLGLRARHFLLAGAHRYAHGRGNGAISDVARNPRSAFQLLHETLTDAETHVLQYHGFKRDNHPGYPEVILSNGSSAPHPELLALAAAIAARATTAGVFDGVQWARLGATGNHQGHHTRAIGGRFYHLEHRYAVRRDPGRRAAMIDAAAEALFGA